MRTRNEVFIAGHIGRDPQKRGNGPYKFSVATGGGKKKDGSGDWPTVWHQIAAWEKQLPEVANLHKGDFVEIDGRLTYPEWKDKDGHERKGCEIVASAITVPLTPDREKKENRAEQNLGITDEDCPF